MSDHAADTFLQTLQFVPVDRFVTNEMLEKLDNVAFANNDIDLDDRDFDTVTFFSDSMDLSTIDLNNINLDEDGFDEDDPTNTVLDRSIAWCNTFKQRKAFKKR